MREQDWPRVVKVLETVSSLDPDYEDTAQRLREGRIRVTLETMYKQGLAALRRRRWEEAAEKFRYILNIDKTYRDATDKFKEAEKQAHLHSLYTKARHLEEMEEWSEAIQAYVQILNIGPDYEDAPQRLMRAEERHRYHKDPADKLKEAEEQKDLLSLYTEAEQLEKMERWSEAIQKYAQIIAIDSSYEDAAQRLAQASDRNRLQLLYDQANALFVEKKWQEAAERFFQVLALDPHYKNKDAAFKAKEAEKHARSQTLYTKGMKFLNNGEWRRAISTFEEIRRLDPGYEAVDARLAEAERQKRFQDLYDEGMACFGRKDWQGAIEKFKQLLSKNSEHPTAAILLEEAKWRQTQEKTKAKPGKVYSLIAWLSSQPLAVKAMIVLAVEVLFVVLVLLGDNPFSHMLRDMLAMNATPTAMISPTVTSVSVASLTPPSTPSSTSTPFPTPTSTPPYPAPTLVSPDEGSSFAKGQDVKLQWEWARDLAEDEFFEVRIRLKGKEKFDRIGLTTLLYQFVLASGLTQAGTYEWQVAIVSPSGEERGVSQIWSFEVR